MKIRKLLFTSVASATLFAFGSKSAIASTSTWHNGNPTFASNHHDWIAGYKRIKDFGHGYMRYTFSFSKSVNGFSMLFYDKNKKRVNTGSAEGTIYKPVYKKISAKTYLMKGTKDVKEQLNYQYKITEHSSKSITILAKGNFTGYYHWKNLGTFKPAKLN